MIYSVSDVTWVAHPTRLIHPVQTLGRIQGTVFTIAGIFNLVQYVLVAVVQGPLDGNPFWVNIGQLVALVPLIALVEMLRNREPDSTTSTEPVSEWSDHESPRLSPSTCPLPSDERPFLARMCSGHGSPSLHAQTKWRLVRNTFQAVRVLNQPPATV